MPTSTLSNTARTVLNTASEHSERLAVPPAHLAAAARRAVVRSLLKTGLLEEVETADGQRALRVTEAGLLAIGTGPAEPGNVLGQTDARAPTLLQPGRREAVRRSAEAVTAAWDDDLANTHPTLASAVTSLRNALSSQRSVHTAFGVPRQPRPNTRRALVLSLLRRPEGATVAQVADATGWARHTVHGFLAGVRKAGTPVEVLERVRQVGPGRQGAVGSYTVYRTAEAG